MKIVEMYQCEICDKSYDTPEKAIECESKGFESPIMEVGAITELIQPSGFYVFVDKVRLREVVPLGHELQYVFEEQMEDDSWDLAHYHEYYGNSELNNALKVFEEFMKEGC